MRESKILIVCYFTGIKIKLANSGRKIYSIFSNGLSISLLGKKCPGCIGAFIVMDGLSVPQKADSLERKGGVGAHPGVLEGLKP